MRKLDPSQFSFDTLAIHAGQEPDPVTGSRAVPIYQTTSYVFEDTQHGADLFGLARPGNIYTRIMNPTTAVLEERMAALEGGVGALAVASGSAAITYSIMNLAGAGDQIVAASTLYGGTLNLLRNTLPHYGITTAFADPDDLDSFVSATTEKTKAWFVESIGNPNGNLVDLQRLSDLAHAQGVPLIVDNTFGTPYLIRPMDYGADIVVHSATKYIDGQGRVLGGAVCGPKHLTDEVFKYLRTAGPTLSAFNAWVLLKGLETLQLRMHAQSAAALELAQWLQAHPKVARVHYPGLPSHPQHALAQRQQASGGAVVSFEVRGAREEAWTVVDQCRLLSITANLGDTKTTITHPASTTHGRISAEARAAAGISEGLLRVAVGLEAVADLQADLDRGLALIPA